MGQKLPERFSITSMDSAFSLSAIDERRGVALIKSSDRPVSASKVLDKIDKQSQLRLHREARIAIFQ
jgi:hypothetical protein